VPIAAIAGVVDMGLLHEAAGGGGSDWAAGASRSVLSRVESRLSSARQAEVLLDALSDAEAMEQTAMLVSGERSAGSQWRLVAATLVARSGDAGRARVMAESAVAHAAREGSTAQDQSEARSVLGALCHEGAGVTVRAAAEDVLERAVAAGVL
jgi:hypothetical protein